MSSSVFFKFKSWKEPQRITFDGTGISVFELKREIINVSGLGDGTDFDLSISNEDNTEQYDDDTTIIPRSTTVIAHRSPASRPGYGRAARYVSGKMPLNAKNVHRSEAALKPATQGTNSATTNGTPASEPQSEEERIAAMFQASGAQWEQQKQQMANVKPAHRNYKPKPDVPDRPLPPNYICYRCHQQGHWIYNCPTNGDSTFDNRPRVKRTTGIPKAFLKTVEKPVSFNSGDGLTDETKQTSGVMMTAEGEYVIAEPDKASWDLFQAKAKAAQEQQKAAACGSQELRDRGLECSIDKRMFVDPVKTPCCGKTYCNDCIENALVNSDLVCPNCSNEGVLIDDLVPDEDVIKRMREYEEEKAKEKKEREASKSPKTENAQLEQENSAEVSESKSKSKSPSPAPANDSSTNTPSATSVNSTPEGGNSKKRAAEEELTNDHIPKAPAAMRRQQEADKAAQDVAVKAMDPTENFIQQMNALGNMQPSQSMSMPFNGSGMPNSMGMMNQNMGMPGMMGGGMGMPMGMGMGMQMNIPGMMGMGNMNPMMNNGWGGGGFNGMNMNGMNGMNGMGMGQGFPQQNNMFGGYPNGGQDMMNGYGQNHNQNPQHWPGQQLSGGNDEDNAYFRKPVNPHRHQNRQRRMARPTDYTEL